MKISKTGATRCQILRPNCKAKMHKNRFPREFRPRSCRGALSAAPPPADNLAVYRPKASVSTRQGKGWRAKGREGEKNRGKEGEGGRGP